MRRITSRLALLAALLLAGCAADSHSSLPAFMRAKEAAPSPPESPPDVPLLVRKNLDMIFVATTQPRELEASIARRADESDAWTACVRAQIISASGAPLRRQTYRLTIKQNEIIDRRRAGSGDYCMSQKYNAVLASK